MMQRMRSLQEHPFGGKQMKRGQTFYANSQEQRVLTALGRAIAIPEDEPTHEPVRKRGLNRRDMRASGRTGEYETK